MIASWEEETDARAYGDGCRVHERCGSSAWANEADELARPVGSSDEQIPEGAERQLGLGDLYLVSLYHEQGRSSQGERAGLGKRDASDAETSNRFGDPRGGFYRCSAHSCLAAFERR